MREELVFTKQKKLSLCFLFWKMYFLIFKELSEISDLVTTKID
jgi:hypothetical protein